MKISELLLIGFVAVSGRCFADEANMGDECASFRMLHQASTGRTMQTMSKNASYAHRLFFSMGTAQQSPRDASIAKRLLEIAPKTSDEIDAWLATGVQTCATSSDKELSEVIKFRNSLPSLLETAVKLVPSQLDSYMKFNIAVSTAVEEDFMSTLPSVCRARKDAFLKAVDRLEPKERAWLSEKVIDLRTCKRIKK